MDKKVVKIIGFTGSLRKGSYNKAALRAAQALMPEGSELELVDLAGIPFLNEDVEAAGIPQPVEAFKQKLAEADGLLISTPEYNYSIPPVLKNALDWASRGKETPLYGKPLAIMSASPGMFGGARAQYQLRQVCVCVNLLPLNKPELMIAAAHTKVSAEGVLEDERSLKGIRELLEALILNIRKEQAQ